MRIVSHVLVALLALEHVWILVLEMFLWTKPTGLKAFGLTPEFAAASAALAKNQGLYNGFLAAGLAWGLLSGEKPEAFKIKVFFTSCVLIAGVFGGITAKTSILYVQALPAAITLAALLAARHAK